MSPRRLKPCSCGACNYEEFEKPHGAPYYRCRKCGAEYMATEVELDDIECPFCGRQAHLIHEPIQQFPAYRCSECGVIVAYGENPNS